MAKAKNNKSPVDSPQRAASREKKRKQRQQIIIVGVSLLLIVSWVLSLLINI